MRGILPPAPGASGAISAHSVTDTRALHEYARLGEEAGRTILRPASEPRGGSTGQRDGVDLDLGAGGQRGDLDRRAGRRLRADVLRVHLVHRGEVAEVRQVDRRLHEPVEAAAGLLEDRSQVREHLLGLLLDRVAHDLRVVGPQGELPRDEDEVAGADRLRVRRALERRGCCLRPNDLLLHQSSLRRVRQLCARATPSALKIASSTCSGSSPSISLTCSVSPAPSASSRRNVPTMSRASPATRASLRSAFETTSGLPEASTTTCASASSAGTTAEPCLRQPSCWNASLSAVPSARPAAATSASA